jgi:hypothetical protein
MSQVETDALQESACQAEHVRRYIDTQGAADMRVFVTFTGS